MGAASRLRISTPAPGMEKSRAGIFKYIRRSPVVVTRVAMAGCRVSPTARQRDRLVPGGQGNTGNVCARTSWGV